MKINSVERCLIIIDLLSRKPKGLRLSEISSELGLNPSTAHHLLNTLLPHDYVTQDPDTKKYALGFRFVEIGSRILDGLDVRKISEPHLQALHKTCNETVHLAVLRHRKIIYIDKIDSHGKLSLATYVGYATDAYAAAGGKILLSDLPDEKIREMYAPDALMMYGKNTITDFSKLFSELQNIRDNGYAVDDEEYYEGVRCIAAPVRAGGKAIAAVSVTGSVFTITRERMEGELIDCVVKTGENISDELKW
jgi:IclR family transcriptional regulator, KDG regulon repressor